MARKADLRAAIVTRLLPTLLTPLRKATVAEGEGFEPPFRRTGKRFSRPPPSTTRPSLRATAFILRAGGPAGKRRGRGFELGGRSAVRSGCSAPGRLDTAAAPRARRPIRPPAGSSRGWR